MSEQEEQQECAAVPAVLTDALVREAVGLAVALVIVVLIDPALRAQARHLAARVFRRPADARRAAEDAAVAEFSRAVSAYDRPGGCGCAD